MVEPNLDHVQTAFQAAATAGGGNFPPVSLTFIDLNYTINIGKGKASKEKVIISNANGYIKAGTFVAIMGPSGSGKTSLLNILAGRVEKSNAHLTGQVLVNGVDRTDSFKRISAYVMQDDVLFSTLTVYETLVVAAELRLESSVPRARKLELVELMISELGLRKARDTPIGNALIRGVSGGERKRTNIAVEMLSNPSIVFLDEPTSGLDSFQAMNVMSTMSDLASSGRTIVSTIHQPRSSIFQLFENLVLLSEGKMVYFGKASNAVEYFSERGLSCPPQFNPADYFLDIISVDRRDEKKEAESVSRIEGLTESFQPSREVQPDLHIKSLLGEAQNEGNKVVYSRYASSWTNQLQVLMRRSWWQLTRDRLPLIIAFVQSLAMVLINSILFSNINNSQKSIQDRQGVIFFVAIFFAFNGVFQMITTFPMERGIINRERAANSYPVSAYYPAKVLSEWPLRCLPTVIFILIAYWPVHFQRSASHFFIFMLTAVLEFTAMNAAGLLVSSVAPTPQTALALGPLMTVIFMLFGGFYVNVDNIPIWVRWFTKCSPIQWAFAGFAVNEFKGIRFTCSPSDKSCIATGEEVLEKLSISNFTVAEAMGYQCVVIIVLHLLAYLALERNGPKIEPITKLGTQKSTSLAANNKGVSSVDPALSTMDVEAPSEKV